MFVASFVGGHLIKCYSLVVGGSCCCFCWGVKKRGFIHLFVTSIGAFCRHFLREKVLFTLVSDFVIVVVAAKKSFVEFSGVDAGRVLRN